MNPELDRFLEKIKYNDPRCVNFNEKCIDLKLRNLLSKINQSLWCWTLFSCQGHKHRDKSFSLPYFVFVVRNEHKGKLVNLIVDTLKDDCISLKLPIYSPYSLEISYGYHDDNFSIISVHWSLSHFKRRGKMKELHEKFEKLAELISEKN